MRVFHYKTMEDLSIRTNRLTNDQRYQLVMDCKASGKSDAQWCLEHGIKPSTFYNWIGRLRSKGYKDIDTAISNINAALVSQDIVKIDTTNTSADTLFIIDEPVDLSFKQQDIKADIPKVITKASPIEITINNATIRISNDASPILLKSLIEGLGGALC